MALQCAGVTFLFFLFFPDKPLLLERFLDSTPFYLMFKKAKGFPYFRPRLWPACGSACCLLVQQHCISVDASQYPVPLRLQIFQQRHDIFGSSLFCLPACSEISYLVYVEAGAAHTTMQQSCHRYERLLPSCHHLLITMRQQCCRLEFLLTRDMVCTGLSMLDFKVQVKHSLEALLFRYGKHATAFPVQAPPPPGAPLDRQRPSKSKSQSQQQGHRYSREGVPLGLKATRVAHAAAVSSRVFSPSMRSPISGQAHPSALPSQHELADTLGFVQRQGSFHSEHAVQHLMTDQPHPQPSSRHLYKHASLPPLRSLHQRDSTDSHQRQSSMPRQSDASEYQSQHSYMSAPRTYSSPRHSQQSPGGYSQRPPVGNSQIIAHSALFQTVPMSPRNCHTPTHQFEQTDHRLGDLAQMDVASQHSYQGHHSSSHDHQQPHAVSHARPASPAPAVARRDSYQSDRSRLGDYPVEPSYQSSSAAPAPAAVGLPLSAFQSADSFASDMLSTDNNQTEQWDTPMLQRIQEGLEAAQPSASLQRASPQSRATDAALQSADSFASDPLSTDMTQTAQWGNRLLSDMQQVGEEERQQEVQTPAEPAVHAALDLQGMHPPTSQTEPGPHDWLWLPDELSTINDSELSSIDGVRPDIDTWLAQQQASRLAAGTAQHGSRRDPRLQQASQRAQQAQQGSSSFNTAGRLQQAVSPTSPLNTSDSLDSTSNNPPQAGDPPSKTHSSLPWAEATTPATHRYSANTTSDAGISCSSQAPPPMPYTSPSQSSGHTSPFAHWSHAPILGASTHADHAAVASHDPQQQQLSPLKSGAMQQHIYSLDDATAKQQELEDRLAALDTLDFPGEGAMFEGFGFEGFGSPVQTRHPTSGQAQIDSFGNQLYNTEAPLPVDAPGATLGAPEEALLASMREMLHGGHHFLLVTMCSALTKSVFVSSLSVLWYVWCTACLHSGVLHCLPACLQEDVYLGRSYWFGRKDFTTNSACWFYLKQH